MKNLIFSILLTVVSLIVNGQQAWNLEQCIQHALENNLQIKQSKLAMETSKVNVNQGKGNFLPDLNGQATHGYNFGKRIDPFTNTFAESQIQSNNFALFGSIDLFTGLRNVNNYKKAKLDYASAEENLRNTEYNIALEVTYAYLDILFNLEALKTSKGQVTQTKQQVDRTKKLVNAGSMPQGALLEIQSQLANEELNVINAENALSLAYLRLKQALLITGSTDFEIIQPSNLDTNAYRLPSSIEYVVETAFDSYPSIKREQLNVESAQKSIAIAKGQLSPTLSLSGSVGSGYSGSQTVVTGSEFLGTSPIGIVQSTSDVVVANRYRTTTKTKEFGDQLKDNINESVTLTLRVPLFNKLSNYTAISRARISRERSTIQLEQEKQRVRQQIEKAYTDAIGARKRFGAAKKSLDSFQNAYDYAQQRFNVGMINAVEFNQSKNNLNRVESELIRAKYEYIFRIKVLDFYKGNPLQL